MRHHGTTDWPTVVAASLLAVACVPRPAAAEPMAAAAARCAAVGDDDATRPYRPSFKASFVRAFSDARWTPDDAALRTGVVRCMDHRLYGCLVGANQPCFKMNAARKNSGAEAFCRENPGSAGVPLAASGHDSIYSYACAGGRATITGTAYTLDRRGFARGLWKPLD